MMTFDSNALKVDAMKGFHSTFVTASYDAFIKFPWLQELRDAVHNAPDAVKVKTFKEFINSHDNVPNCPHCATLAQVADDKWFINTGAPTADDLKRRDNFIKNYIGDVKDHNWNETHIHRGNGKPKGSKGSIKATDDYALKVRQFRLFLDDRHNDSPEIDRLYNNICPILDQLNAEFKRIEEERIKAEQAKNEELNAAKAALAGKSREDLIKLLMEAGLAK